MSLFTRISNLFTKEVDGYAFEKTVYESVTDYVHGDGVVVKTIYVPSYDIYAHYYSNTVEFIPYKSVEPFNEFDETYKNVRKIKISPSFCGYLCDWYEIREENKKWCDQNKSYFDEITK